MSKQKFDLSNVGQQAFSLLATVSLLLAAPPSLAQQGSANARTIAEGCRVLMAIESGQAEPPNLPRDELELGILQAGFCAGYINGFRSGFSFGAYESQAVSAKQFCIPGAVTNQQIARMIIKFVDDHPEFEHNEALPFMIGIMKIHFPCEAR